VQAFPAGKTPGLYENGYRTAGVKPDGSFEINGLGTGSYKLKFGGGWETTLIPVWNGGADSFETASPINVVLGQDTAGVNITLGQLATVSGKAAVPAGADASKISVSLSSADEAKSTHSSQTQIGPDGSYKFTGVPAGDYKVHFYDTSHYTLAHWYGGTDDAATAKIVKVATSQAVSGIDTTIVKAGSLSGRISGPQGTDLSGTFDIYKDDADRTWSGRGRVQPDGTYRFPALPAGSYKMSFWVSTSRDLWYKNAASFESATPVTVVDAQETTGLDFDLPAAPSFTDVAPGMQFSSEIMWMAEVGVQPVGRNRAG
jgi:hypothetical protein